MLKMRRIVNRIYIWVLNRLFWVKVVFSKVRKVKSLIFIVCEIFVIVGIF